MSILVLERIISGGQTGADQGGLEAARALNLKTGGTMPKGFRTETRPRPDFSDLYGLVPDKSSDYLPRTRINILISSATLIFGEVSGGSAKTLQLCKDLNKNYFLVPWPLSDTYNGWREDFVDWLQHYEILTLNVAGNRESKNPGIQAATKDFLISALRPLLTT